MNDRPSLHARRAKIAERRRALAERTGIAAPTPPAHVSAIIADAAKLPGVAGEGTRVDREWRAAHNLDEVERMSIAGLPVAQIAATLGLSKRHVVALRARLSVGRRR